LNKKRRLSENKSPSATKKKKPKTSSKPPATQNNQGTSPSSSKVTYNSTSRPKRGLTQLKEGNKYKPYKEEWEHSSNPVGHNVRYTRNVNFRPNLVKSKKDKHECAGQAFTVQLNKRQGWNVKATSSDGFVLFKNCNMCTSSEQSAKEGRDKFTGYSKIADFVYKSGMVSELVKGSKELKDILQSLDLSCTDVEQPSEESETAQNTNTTNQPSEGLVDPPSVENTATRTSQLREMTASDVANPTATVPTVLAGNTSRSNGNEVNQLAIEQNQPRSSSNNHVGSVFESTVHQLNKLKQVRKVVSEQLAHARTTYIGANELFKRDASVNFFNTLDNCMLKLAYINTTNQFKLEDIQVAIKAFEDMMTDLTKSEEEGDENGIRFHERIIKSLVESTKNTFLNDEC
jgi:hypothetical protein